MGNRIKLMLLNDLTGHLYLEVAKINLSGEVIEPVRRFEIDDLKYALQFVEDERILEPFEDFVLSGFGYWDPYEPPLQKSATSCGNPRCTCNFQRAWNREVLDIKG